MAALFDPKKNQIAAFQKAIEDNSRLIGQLFDEIGKLYYRQYRDMNADVSRDINARCESISHLYVDNEILRLKILYERGFKECKNCKKENLLEHQYCSACGSKFPESNDINVVTTVDPERFGVIVPEVNKVPEENEVKQTEGATAMPEGLYDAIPQETEEPQVTGGTIPADDPMTEPTD
ncbi:MAG: hypothetical protein IJL60_11625 [Clostridiales bacterium]|nr:hypothetical protein [Clostridiales bacterium]MBQ6270535.1 hypothetical protein [Clostridiales bacterium]